MDCKNGLPASNAIDGTVCNQKCGAHSNKDAAWPLLVDLKSPTKINFIVIYGRQDTDWGYSRFYITWPVFKPVFEALRRAKLTKPSAKDVGFLEFL